MVLSSVLIDVNFVLFPLQFTSDTGIIHRPPCLTKKKPSRNLFWESWMTGYDIHTGCLLKLCSLLTNQSRLLSCCVKQVWFLFEGNRKTWKHGNGNWNGMGQAWISLISILSAKSVALSLSWHHTWFVLQVQNKGTSATEVGRTNDCIACSSVASYLAATQSVHTSPVVTHGPMVMKQLCPQSVRLWICCSSHVPMFSNCQLFIVVYVIQPDSCHPQLIFCTVLFCDTTR